MPLLADVAQVSPYVIDNSTVLPIICQRFMGTAFYLGNGQYLTARHVADNKACMIAREPVSILAVSTGDKDWALISSPYRPPFRVLYSCNRMHPGSNYLASGYADANGWIVTTRLIASDERDADGTREMKGLLVSGMSGGPVADLDGAVHGINIWVAGNGSSRVPLSGVTELADTPICRTK